MNGMSREEAEARIEAIESRMDGRVAAFQASCERYLAEQAAQIGALQASLELTGSQQREKLEAYEVQQRTEREHQAATLRSERETLEQKLRAEKEARDKLLRVERAALEQRLRAQENQLRAEKEALEQRLRAQENQLRADKERWEAAQRMERDQRETELRNQQALHDANMEEFRRINRDIFRKLDQLFTTVIVTGISSVIAIILGVGAINATIVNNMFASYNEGKLRANWEARIEQRLPPAPPTQPANAAPLSK